MERGEPIAVLVVKLRRSHPREQINKSDLTFGVTRPVHRRAASVVTTADVYAFVSKIIERDGLVTLCSYVHDIDAVVVAGLDIRAVLKQQITKRGVSFKRAKVEGGESVRSRFEVDPLSHHQGRQRLCCVLDQRLRQRLKVLEARFVQEGVAALVHDVDQRNLGVYLETGHHSGLVAFLNVSKGLVYNVFYLNLGLAGLLDFI